MAVGIATQGYIEGELRTLMYSPSMNGVFFNNSGTYTTTADIPVNNFSNLYSIATPIETTYTDYMKDFANTSMYLRAYRVAGMARGSRYYAPSVIHTGGTNADYLGRSHAPTITGASSFVYSFGTPPSPTGYGIFSKGSTTSNFSVTDKKSFYIHPRSTGYIMRTGSATGFVNNADSTFYDNDFYQSTDIHIYFDKAYVNPPLIFITESSNYISLNYMSRDGLGRFTGASISVAASLANGGQQQGTGYYTRNSATFTYFIVSDEEPVYMTPSAYGLRVWNAGGSKVFDSAYLSPNFQAASINIPYANMTSSSYSSVNGVSFNIGTSLGVCINNFNSITGCSAYNAWTTYDYLASYSTASGPNNILGRGVYVVKNYSGGSHINSSVYLSGVGSNCNSAFTFPFTYSSGPPPTYTRSYDFMVGQTATMDVLFCNWRF